MQVIKRDGRKVEFYDYAHNNAHIDFVVRNNKNDNLNQVVDKIYQYICDCERRRGDI